MHKEGRFVPPNLQLSDEIFVSESVFVDFQVEHVEIHRESEVFVDPNDAMGD